MNTVINPAAYEKHVCPKCGTSGVAAEISQNAYRCRQCGYEMAHVDVAANGAVRGLFGWLKEVGDIVGERYKVQTVLGKGGFGATYLVEDQRVKGKRWALKEIPDMLFDEFEESLLSHLDHPAIPIIADRFTENSMVYLVLKFGGTRTLASETKNKGRIPYTELKNIVTQIGDVLEYLHSRTPPIIHRDLKPENVLLDDTGRIMVIDFGIAKESAPATMTRTLGRAASFGFSPPEQVMGTGTDTRSDIYSLSATVYFALTGNTPVAAHERVAGKPLPPPKGVAADLPDEVNDIVLRGLNLNINERPQTVREFTDVFAGMHLGATDPLLAGKTVQISEIQFGPVLNTHVNRSQPLTAADTSSSRNPQRSAWIIVIGASLTIVAIAASGIYWYLNKEKQPETTINAPTPTISPPLPVAPSAQPVSPMPPAVTTPAITQPAPTTATLPSTTPSTVPSSSPPSQQSNAPSALDVLNQRRTTQSVEEPEPDKTTNSAESLLKPTTPKTTTPKTASTAKTYTSKPAIRPKPKTERRQAPDPEPTPKQESSSSSWVIIPGQTQKKY